jgi:hypothetical protein
LVRILLHPRIHIQQRYLIRAGPIGLAPPGIRAACILILEATSAELRVHWFTDSGGVVLLFWYFPLFITQIYQTLPDERNNSCARRPRLTALCMKGGEVLSPLPEKGTALEIMHNTES